MAEQWAAVKGFKGYEVSTQGRFRSYWTRSTEKAGHIDMKKPPRILKFSKDDRGCLFVTLYKGPPDARVSRNTPVARTVLAAFVRDPQPLEIVRYKDDDRGNCKKSNLAWTTRAAEGKRARDATRPPASAVPTARRAQRPRKASVAAVAPTPDFKRKKGGNPQRGKRVPAAA